jgi:hypothetical protein
VWAASGGQCGEYLAAPMRTQLDGLERHGELADGVGRYSMAVRAELLAMSAASIDRYLRPVKAADRIRGVTTTKPSARPSSITEAERRVSQRVDLGGEDTLPQEARGERSGLLPSAPLRRAKRVAGLADADLTQPCAVDIDDPDLLIVVAARVDAIAREGEQLTVG